MPYVDPQTVEKAREMDLLTYLQNYEPNELVRLSDGTYCTRTHKNLKRKVDVVVKGFRRLLCP